MHIAPFAIDVPDEVLSDLRTRIRHTRWPAKAPGVAWAQGSDLEYLRRLLGYWADGFDWRAQERQLNTFEHFRAELGDTHVHFVHETLGLSRLARPSRRTSPHRLPSDDRKH